MNNLFWLSASICGVMRWTDGLIDHLHAWESGLLYAWGNKLSGDAPAAVQSNDTPASHRSISLLNIISNTNTNIDTNKIHKYKLSGDAPAVQLNDTPASHHSISK